MMKYFKIILLFTFAVALLPVNAQVIENKAFGDGEQLQFTGYYNWGFLWVNAGEVKVNVKDATHKGKSTFQIKGAGRNAKAFEMFFKLRDTLTTYVDKKTLKPYALDRITNEGDYHTRHVYSYHYPQGNILAYIKKNDNKVKRLEIPFEGCVNNLMSVLYYARNINYDNLQKGQRVPLKILVDGKISDVEVIYRGVDKVKVRRGRKYLCYKITPVLPGGAMFEEGEGMVVWLSKDKNRVPIMVEAKIRVGSVKGILKNYRGLRHEDNIFGNTEGSFEKAN